MLTTEFRVKIHNIYCCCMWEVVQLTDVLTTERKSNYKKLLRHAELQIKIAVNCKGQNDNCLYVFNFPNPSNKYTPTAIRTYIHSY